MRHIWYFIRNLITISLEKQNCLLKYTTKKFILQINCLQNRHSYSILLLYLSFEKDFLYSTRVLGVFGTHCWFSYHTINGSHSVSFIELIIL